MERTEDWIKAKFGKVSGDQIISVMIPIIFLVGFVGYSLPGTRSLFLLLTPFLLYSIASVVVFLETRRQSFFLIFFLVAALITFLIEVVGVKTNMIFGDYQYKDTLGMGLFGVPFIIGFNWVIVILGGYSLVEKLKLPTILAVILGGFVTVLFDFLMEPVAINFNYWIWKDGSIPLQNYIAWFVITVFVLVFVHFFKLKTNTLVIKSVFLSQLMFFLLLRVWLLL